MHRRFAAAVAAGVIALAPGASASPGYGYSGGCELLGTTDPTGEVANPGTVTGVLGVVVIATAADPAANPVAATVICEIRVNGTTQVTTAAAGTTVVTGAEPVAYQAYAGSEVTVCEQVTFPDWTQITNCEDLPDVVPPEVRDIATAVVRDIADPVVCPALAALAGDYGPVTVTGQGDVFRGGHLVKDCAPYDPDIGPWEPLLTSEMDVAGTIEVAGSPRHDPQTDQWYTDADVTLGGFFANPSLWYCEEEAIGGGPGPWGSFVVTCQPVSGITWTCQGARAVAEVHPRLDLIDDGADIRPVGPPVWGRAAAKASCSAPPGTDRWVRTEEADESQPVRHAAETFVVTPVSEVRCEVNRDGHRPAEGPYQAVCQFP